MREVSRQSLRARDVFRVGDGTHLRAIEGDSPASDQSMAAARMNKRGTLGDDRFGIVVSECGYRPIVRSESPQQPEGFRIAMAVPKGAGLASCPKKYIDISGKRRKIPIIYDGLWPLSYHI
ncbi:hypothetical protein [Sphingomonas sp.]|uniref:hypothetical protein n=1 Tax=Sphingomonas sp. TaxID=28214 RepID=UPI001EBF61FF|nr:hypothetical protein [Sphingomonas sp.]MBX3595257.1 hypothetical protein [Sphingomonas sp.]